METHYMFNKEKYASPEAEVIPLALQSCVLSDTGEPIGGGDNPDIPIPGTSN